MADPRPELHTQSTCIADRQGTLLTLSLFDYLLGYIPPPGPDLKEGWKMADLQHDAISCHASDFGSKHRLIQLATCCEMRFTFSRSSSPIPTNYSEF
ncbi:Uncharacterized protein HZ326_14649 [Fusarium oxysporum f. sp. albedinis]|nr:Uncharacterized protein HZ326_14649 [Fusarium oxysporum f. sp. albedinis]